MNKQFRQFRKGSIVRWSFDSRKFEYGFISRQLYESPYNGNNYEVVQIKNGDTKNFHYTWLHPCNKVERAVQKLLLGDKDV